MKLFSHLKKIKPEKIKAEKITSRLFNDPYLDWPIVLVVTTILVAGTATLGVITYLDVGRQLGDGTKSTSGSEKIIDTVMLDYVLHEFDQKAIERQSILKQYSGPGDPSL